MKRWLLAILLLVANPAWGSRIITTGFEENDGSSGNKTATDAGTGATITFSTTKVHSGTYSLKMVSTSSATKTIRRTLATALGNGTDLYNSYYFLVSDLPDTDSDLFYERTNSANLGGMILIKSTGEVGIKNSVTATTSYTTSPLSLDTWYRLEYHNHIANSGGSITLSVYLVDATTAIETLSITGEDTLRDTTVSTLVIGNPTAAANYTWYFDDWIANSGAGSSPFNGAVGPHKIALLTPNADTAAAWTKAGGTPAATNYGGVDDIPGTPVDATDFNTDAQATNVDRLGLSALPAEVTSDATMISLDAYARVNAASTATSMKLRVWDEGGSSSDGPSISLPDATWKILSTDEHYALTLSGKTKANVNAYDAGYIGGAADGNTKQIGALWVNVEWLEATSSPPPAGISLHHCTTP